MTQPGSDAQPGGLFSEPWKIIQAARAAVPAVDYALGAAGIAAAGALVTLFLGKDRASIIIFSGILIAMVLLFVFSRLVRSTNQSTFYAGMVMLWSVIVFFVIFLFATATAAIGEWPRPWSIFLGFTVPPPPPPALSCAPTPNPDGSLSEKCGLTIAEARSTALQTLRRIEEQVARVLSVKEIALFPEMDEYLVATTTAQREKHWQTIRDVLVGKTGLLTNLDVASTALLDLDAKLLVNVGGPQLAQDPATVRGLLKAIRSTFSRRTSIADEMQGSADLPSTEQMERWRRSLEALVPELEGYLHELQLKLNEPIISA